MNRLPHYCIFLLILFASTSGYSKTSICIKNQQSFDSLSNRIGELVKRGERDIYVYFKSGVYVAARNQIKLARLKAPDTDIHFIGKKDVFIVPQGAVYKNGDTYQGEYSINHSWMSGTKDLEIWSTVKYANGVVEIINEKQKECRLKVSDKIQDDLSCEHVSIMIPAWYQTYYYKVSKIEDGYIYFIADNLKKSYNDGYNVNDDYNYAQKRIRYKLCNIEEGEDYVRIIGGKVVLPKGVSTAREGKISNIISIQECAFGTFEIKGIQFCGNGYGKYSSLITFENTTFQKGVIRNCAFYGMKSTVIDINSTSNVSVYNNDFKDCHYQGIISDNKSPNTTIKKNSFKQMGKRMLASPSITCGGTDYCVSGNEITDYGYCGISVGIWFGTKAEEKSSGIIEYNKLVYTDQYIENIENTGIMDGGAIYVFTKNDGAIIRNNEIRNYTGIWDDRGILCDDGTYGVQIYGNVITGINDNYSIDCRRVKRVEASVYPTSEIERSNINIVIRDNIVDSPIRFEGHEDSDNGCYKGHNIILYSSEKSSLQSIYKNVSNVDEDIIIYPVAVEKGAYVVSRKDYKFLHGRNNWKLLKKSIVKE